MLSCMCCCIAGSIYNNQANPEEYLTQQVFSKEEEARKQQKWFWRFLGQLGYQKGHSWSPSLPVHIILHKGLQKSLLLNVF